MKFKAKLSPTQTFSIKNRRYKAINYIFETDDSDLIKFLENNNFWDKVTENKKLIEKELTEKKIEDIEPKKKVENLINKKEN